MGGSHCFPRTRSQLLLIPLAMSDFAVDFTKSYARRRPDEPRSHYSSRLKFINAMIKGEGESVTDERIEVLSHCYSNVKYLSNIYGKEIMGMLQKYDPEIPME